MQPVGELLEPPELALVHLGVAVGIQTHEDLREVRVVVEDVLAEVLVVLEVELLLAGLLDRLGELEPVLAGERRDVGAELLVDENARRVGVDAALDGDLHALVDQLLGVADRVGLLRGRVALDPEHLLLEGAPVVEGEDVELSVVAEGHGRSTFVVTWRERPQATLPRREAELQRPELHARHRGGADDRRARRPGTSSTRSRDLLEDSGAERRRRLAASSPSSTSRCSRSPPSRARTRARRAPSCAACAARSPRSPAAATSPIGSAGTHPFARWEDQRISGRPRYRDLIDGAALRRAPGGHLRAARPRRDRRRRQGHPRRQRHARPRAAAARAVGQLAVLARPGDRAGLDPDADLPPVPARRDAARLRRLEGLRRAHRLHGRGEDRSRTTPTSGTTSARTRTSARSRCARWTRRRGSSTRSGSRR